jgi:hypothetical protein
MTLPAGFMDNWINGLMGRPSPGALSQRIYPSIHSSTNPTPV